jgi:hypothetical protein
MMEAIHCSETSFLTKVTWRNIREDGILHSDRSENHKSHINKITELCSSCTQKTNISKNEAYKIRKIVKTNFCFMKTVPYPSGAMYMRTVRKFCAC